jgi:hypothetical protein
VLEEVARVLNGNRRDRGADRLHERLPSPGLAFTKEALDLGEGFFDRVEVRGVGRQVQQLTTSPFDNLSYPLSFMSAQVVSSTTTWPLRSVGARTCST